MVSLLIPLQKYIDSLRLKQFYEEKRISFHCLLLTSQIKLTYYLLHMLFKGEKKKKLYEVFFKFILMEEVAH